MSWYQPWKRQLVVDLVETITFQAAKPLYLVLRGRGPIVVIVLQPWSWVFPVGRQLESCIPSYSIFPWPVLASEPVSCRSRSGSDGLYSPWWCIFKNGVGNSIFRTPELLLWIPCYTCHNCTWPLPKSGSRKLLGVIFCTLNRAGIVSCFLQSCLHLFRPSVPGQGQNRKEWVQRRLALSHPRMLLCKPLTMKM